MGRGTVGRGTFLLNLQCAVESIQAFDFLKLGVYGGSIFLLGSFGKLLQQTASCAFFVVSAPMTLNHVTGEMPVDDAVGGAVQDLGPVKREFGRLNNIVHQTF